MQGKNKKLIQINTVCNASTGRIMGDIQREAIRQGYDTFSFVGRRKPFPDIPCEKFGNFFSFWGHVVMNTVFDRQGYGSYFSTKKLIRRLREDQPDIIHLHNLHGYYLYLPALFRYLKQEFTGQIFWTFHDCWPFTGHCPYFTMIGCNKWEEKCYACPNKRSYPISLFFDASTRNYKDKRRMFSGFSNLTIITPSAWMEKLVKKSFMNQYPTEIISNGIDLSIFTYTKDSSIYAKYNIPRNKKVLLGVANIWDQRKGLDDFLALSKEISDEYRIILVGLSKSQIRKLPRNVIGIVRTENQRELVALYSLAEIFVNPSLEESFSLVTVEAIACGTPVIVLDTSAVKELVTTENGIVLHKHGTQEYLAAIREIEGLQLQRKEISRTAEKYDNCKTAERVVDLYRKSYE